MFGLKSATSRDLGGQHFVVLLVPTVLQHLLSYQFTLLDKFTAMPLIDILLTFIAASKT